MSDATGSILVLTTWPFGSGLIQAYTLPYLEIIATHLKPDSRIFLVTQEPAEDAWRATAAEQIHKSLLGQRIDWVPQPYRRFGSRAIMHALVRLVALRRLCRVNRVEAIHCFCTPAGCTGYALSILTGIPLILDSYEPHAEAMVENGTWSRAGLAFNLLFALEKLQSLRARAVIAASPGMRDYARDRYKLNLDVFCSKPACVNLKLFDPQRFSGGEEKKALGLDGKIVCVYSGKIGGIYLEREIFDFFKAAQDYWKDSFRALLLSGDSRERIDALCEGSGFAPSLLVHRSVPHQDVPRYLAAADFAITPVKPVPTKRYCAPIKDGEYWAMGLPVVITEKISEDSDIVEQEQIGAVLQSLSPQGYREAIETIARLLGGQSREDLRQRIRMVAANRRGFDKAEEAYSLVYGSLARA